MATKTKRPTTVVLVVVCVLIVVAVVIGVSFAIGQKNAATPRKSNKPPKLILGSYNPKLGFFSNLLNIFNLVKTAENNGYEPLVVLNNGPYTEKRPGMQPIHYDAKNWFNNYFQPIGDRNTDKYIEKLGKLPVFPRHPNKHHLYEYNFQSLQNTPDRMNIDQHRQIWQKHFVVLPFILEKVDQFVNDNLPTEKKFVLGVHYRGTDTNKNKDQKTRNTAYGVIKLAVQLELEKNPSVNAIFIASDEQPFIDYFQSKTWSVPTVCSDSTRSQKNTSFTKTKRVDSKDTVHLGLQNCNRFLKGQDVLLDALILSKCYKVIATRSSLVHFLKVLNVDVEVISI